MADYPTKNSAYNTERPPSLSPIEDFARYLLEAERSPLTIRSYLSDLSAFARWFQEANGSPLEPAKVTAIDLREYKQHLVAHRKLKPSTVNRKLAALRSFLSWAARTELIRDGKIPKIPAAVNENRLGPRWLDRLEQNSLLRAVERARNPRDAAIVRLLLNTGLRIREFCSLSWADVQMTERKGTILVRRGKGGKQREIPLNKDARSSLLSLGYQENAGKHQSVAVGQRGPMTPRGVQIMLRKYAKLAELDGASAHSLRHTFCKNLIDAGAGLHEVAALAGHESLETTRRYCEPSLKDLEKTISLIGEED